MEITIAIPILSYVYHYHVIVSLISTNRHALTG